MQLFVDPSNKGHLNVHVARRLLCCNIKFGNYEPCNFASIGSIATVKPRYSEVEGGAVITSF